MGLITQLTAQVQQSPPSSESRVLALTALVEQTMRTRSICRPRPGRRLEGIYLDLLQAAKEKLRGEIDRAIDQYNPQGMSVKDWLTASRDRVFQEVLEPDVLEQLAIRAQSHACRNRDEQRQALTELIQALRLSGRLLSRGKYPAEIYGDGVNRILLYVAENIDAYNPKRGRFIAWVNYRFSKILQEAQQELKDPFIQSLNGLLIRKKYQLTALVQRVGQAGLNRWLELALKTRLASQDANGPIVGILALMSWLAQLRERDRRAADSLLLEVAKTSLPPLTLADLDGQSMTIDELAVPREQPLLSEQVREYLTIDPEGLCQQGLRSWPQVTFRSVALAYLDGQSWQEIAERFGVSVSAVKNFFQRRLKSISPSLKRYIHSEFA